MRGFAELHVRLVFAPTGDGPLSHPREALGDVLKVIRAVEPDRFDFVFLRNGGELEADFCIGLPEARAASLDLVRAALIRAEAQAGYTTIFGQTDLESYAGWQFARPICNDPALAGQPFALPLPLAAPERPLFSSLAMADLPTGYALFSRPAETDHEAAKTLSAPLSFAINERSAPPALAAALRKSLDAMLVPGCAAIEGICLRDDAPDAAADALEATLMEFVGKLYPDLPADLFSIEWDELSGDAHRETTAPPPMTAIEIRRPSDYASLTVGSALEEVARDVWTGPRMATVEATPGPVVSRPDPAAPFAFLSYAHKDAPWVDELTGALRQSGLNLWSDHLLEVGEIWDEQLEARIRDSAFLLACVSPKYEQSRFCRREIKFADMLGKPILPLSRQKHVWGPGLQFLFQELQIVVANDNSATGKIVERVRMMAPECILGGGD